MLPGVSTSGRLNEMVPVERIELPTFGLQNRCSTAELNRHLVVFAGKKKFLERWSLLAASSPSALESSRGEIAEFAERD